MTGKVRRQKGQTAKKSDTKMRKSIASVPEGADQEETPLNHEHERILKWLKQVRFKKNFFGGVNEADVWKKIGELNALYETALSAERARYDALLQERVQPGNVQRLQQEQTVAVENRGQENGDGKDN